MSFSLLPRVSFVKEVLPAQGIGSRPIPTTVSASLGQTPSVAVDGAAAEAAAG